MELKEAFTRSISEVFTLYRMHPQFPPETTEFSVPFEEQVCVLISFTEVLKGKVVFKLNKSLGEKIASFMTETTVESFDATVKSGLGEIMSFTATLALSKYNVVKNVSLLPSIIIKGEDISLMLSGTKSYNLVCQLFNEYISIIYCLE